MISQQFDRAFGFNSWQLTAEPLRRMSAAWTKVDNVLQRVNETVPGPKSYPPLIRAFYYRFLRSMSVFSGKGKDWVMKGEGWVENESIPILYRWMIATQFDLLSFVEYYLTLFGHLKNIAWYGTADKQHLLNNYYVYPFLLPTTQYPMVLNEHKSKINAGGSFRLHKRLDEHHPNQQTPEVINMRRIKLEKFTNVWKEFADHTASVVREETKQVPPTKASHRFVERFWQVCSTSPTLDDLPPPWRKFIELWMRGLAVIVDNIFDDPAYRRKIEAIWKGIPINVILTSLRVVNPIPFIDQMIKIFCWRPLGVDSLLQRLGALLSASNRTNSELSEVSKKIQSSTAQQIRSLIDKELDRTLFIEAKISTRDPAALRAFLQRQIKDVTPIMMEYSILYLRKREKEEFVTALGGNEVVEFIKHIASIIPPILTQVWKCGNFHKLATEMVSMVNHTLAELDNYDKCVGPSEHINAFPSIVENMTSHFESFVGTAWPFLHQLSKRPPDGPAGLHALADWFFSEIIMPITELPGSDGSDSREPVVSIASDVTYVLERLDEDQRKKVWQEVDRMIVLMQNGVDQRDWEDMSVVDGEACGLFSLFIAGQCMGGATQREAQRDEGPLRDANL